MRSIRLSALAVTIAGLATAQAEEAVTAATGPVTADPPPAAATYWSAVTEDSSLVSQARAASAAQRARLAAARGVTVETVNVMFADSRPPQSGNNGFCQHVTAHPGSLFMRERCFYEGPAEAALNDYQIERDYEDFLQQQYRDFLEVAEYSLQYRRSLMNQR